MRKLEYDVIKNKMAFKKGDHLESVRFLRRYWLLVDLWSPNIEQGLALSRNHHQTMKMRKMKTTTTKNSRQSF